MTHTQNIGLTYLAPAQAQKHVTVNEALRLLDIVVQPHVIGKDLAAPPTSPAPGDAYIVGAGASGAWAGHENDMAAWIDGVWMFSHPNAGWQTYVNNLSKTYVFDGTGWQVSGLDKDDLNNLPMVGINTAADSTNRLAVKSDAVLFDNAGTHSQVTVNKSSATDKASTLYQNGYSGRAEVGLIGDDNFTIKVSDDGSAFHEAIKIQPSTQVKLNCIQKTAPALTWGGFCGQSLTNGDTEVAIGQSENAPYPLYFQGRTTSNAAQNISLNPLGGKVSIGTENPYGTFHVMGSAGLSRSVYLDNREIKFIGSGVAHFSIFGPDTGKSYMVIQNTSNNIAPGASGTDLLAVTSDGDVGIGLTNPACKLDVDGTVKMKSYTVSTAPPPSNTGAGTLIFVSDENGGATLAFSDGADWPRTADRAVIS